MVQEKLRPTRCFPLRLPQPYASAGAGGGSRLLRRCIARVLRAVLLCPVLVSFAHSGLPFSQPVSFVLWKGACRMCSERNLWEGGGLCGDRRGNQRGHLSLSHQFLNFCQRARYRVIYKHSPRRRMVRMPPPSNIEHGSSQGTHHAAQRRRSISLPLPSLLPLPLPASMSLSQLQCSPVPSPLCPPLHKLFSPAAPHKSPSNGTQHAIGLPSLHSAARSCSSC